MNCCQQKRPPILIHHDELKNAIPCVNFPHKEDLINLINLEKLQLVYTELGISQSLHLGSE
eukprot:1155198-Pelagomonas_calceolata.AAC.3